VSNSSQHANAEKSWTGWIDGSEVGQDDCDEHSQLKRGVATLRRMHVVYHLISTGGWYHPLAEFTSHGSEGPILGVSTAFVALCCCIVFAMCAFCKP
jgi:hypothetical protein